MGRRVMGLRGMAAAADDCLCACACACMCVCVCVSSSLPRKVAPEKLFMVAVEKLFMRRRSVVPCLHRRSTTASDRARLRLPSTCLGCEIGIYLEPPLSVGSTPQSRWGLLTGVDAPGGR
jgi:hypothetical protein